MHVVHLSLTDFRSYESVDVDLDAGVSTLAWSADDEVVAVGTSQGTLSCVGFNA